MKFGDKAMRKHAYYLGPGEPATAAWRVCVVLVCRGHKVTVVYEDGTIEDVEPEHIRACEW